LIDSITAGLIFGMAILALTAFMASLAAKHTDVRQSFLAIVTTLIGFATGGGLATVFVAPIAAEQAAGKAAPEAAQQAAQQVAPTVAERAAEDVSEQVSAEVDQAVAAGRR